MTTTTGTETTPTTTAAGTTAAPAGTTAAGTDDTPPTDVEQDEGTDDDDEELDGRTRAGRQAARYRAALREAEGQRDTATARVEQLQRAQVEQLAATALAQGGDLLELGGVQLGDLLDEDGDVDPELVAAAATTLLAGRPGLRAPTRTADAGRAGIGAQGDREAATEAPTWQGVLRGGKR